MKKTYIILYPLLALLWLSNTKPAHQHSIRQAEWLVGTWENKTSRGSLYENWSKLHENELAGKSYMIRDKDTMVFETIRLLQEKNTLFYIPTVKNQNDDQPVRFALKNMTDSLLVFENPEHDFPQVITYRKVRADSLVAEISGIRNGQERKQQFPMKKISSR